MDDGISLAIGMTAISRPDITLRQSAGMLRYAFPADEIHVFAEPLMPLEFLYGVHIHCNWSRLGVCGNWVHCLNWLLRQTTADHLLVVENDVRYCAGARQMLVEHLAAQSDYGFCSLYTPVGRAEHFGEKKGWVTYNEGWSTWGAQALCLHRRGAEELLQDGRIVDVIRDPDAVDEAGGMDSVVGDFYLRWPSPSWYHVPSLTDHLGVLSSRSGHAVAARHRGLDFDQNYGSLPSRQAEPHPLSAAGRETEAAG